MDTRTEHPITDPGPEPAYYLQPDGIAHIWSVDGMVKSTAGEDDAGVLVDGLACETMADALDAD